MDLVSEEPTLAPPSAKDEGPSRVVGSWRLERELGRGGMSSVWLARHAFLGHRAAVKVLRDELATDPVFARRFEDEARLGARLRHPNLVQIYDYLAPPGGRPCIVMEFVDGPTLDQLAGGAPMEPALAQALLLQVALALSEVHYLGVVHRDVKAPNVLVETGRDGRRTAKVVDFGIAKSALVGGGLTLPGTTVGTPQYMAPEQVMGGPVDFRSDVYALGILGYRLLAGRLPFDGALPEVLAQQVQAEPPPLVHGPKELREVVARAMAKRPGDRFDTAGELARALREVRPDREATPAPGAAPPKPIAPKPIAPKPIAPPPVAVSAHAGRHQRADRFRRRFTVLFGPNDSPARAGFTSNISPTGLGLVTKHPQRAGTRVFVQFSSAPGRPLAQGFVVWSKAPAVPGANGAMGIKLDGADEAFFQLLADAAHVERAAPAPRGQVMVVEDNRDVRQLLHEAFAAEGFEVLDCADGGLALAAMSRLARPCAVVLDLSMPLVDGWKVVETMRATPEHRDLPLLVLSAHPDALKVPATRHLAKPFELDEVVRTVKELVALPPR